jgi:hypothetical protein
LNRSLYILNRSLYIWPERDRVKAFAYKKDPEEKHGKFLTNATAKGLEAGHWMPGGFLSISADGMKNGILWASLPMHDDAWIDIVRGALRAFRITTGRRLSRPGRRTAPTRKNGSISLRTFRRRIANGKVYLATFSGFVSVYGLLTSPLPGLVPSPNCKVSKLMMEPSYKKTHHAAHGKQ